MDNDDGFDKYQFMWNISIGDIEQAEGEAKKKLLSLIVEMYSKELIDIIGLDKDENVETEEDSTNWDLSGNTETRDPKGRCKESRFWFCTFWSKYTDYNTLKMIFNKDGFSGIICKEYCQNGDEHIHLYVVFPLGTKFRMLEKLHSYGIRKGKILKSGKKAFPKAIEYCRKDGNYETWGNIEVPLYKVGQNILPLKNM